MKNFEQAAALVTAPSPPAGEGISGIRYTHAWVRGRLATLPIQRQPLTRRRFAPALSPARGESSSGARVA
jgi:hypothetical protein